MAASEFSQCTPCVPCCWSSHVTRQLVEHCAFRSSVPSFPRRAHVACILPPPLHPPPPPPPCCTMTPGVEALPAYVPFQPVTPSPLRQQFPGASDDALDLLARMVALDPRRRPSGGHQLCAPHHITASALSLPPCVAQRCLLQKPIGLPQPAALPANTHFLLPSGSQCCAVCVLMRLVLLAALLLCAPQLLRRCVIPTSAMRPSQHRQSASPSHRSAKTIHYRGQLAGHQ